MQLIDYGIILLYLIITMILGLIFTEDASKDPEEFILAGRRLPWWMLGASGMASNTDVAGTMVIAALIYAIGTQGFYIEIRGGVVLIMSFLMAFMGKWNRRARVLTTAEWMKFRFGEGKQGRVARLISAIAAILFSIGTMSFFAVAGGKFLGQILGVDQLLIQFFGFDSNLAVQWGDHLASICLILLSLVYTTASGFYGVVVTDTFQGFLILIAVIYVSALAFFTVTLPETFSVAIPGSDIPKTWNFADWSSVLPATNLDLLGDYAIFNLFAGVLFFYFLKTVIEGCSGSGGYMVQRYLAAKNDRDAGLLSLLWIILLAFRWPLVTAFAVLGIHYGLTQGIVTDPELILPIVITQYVPVGMKGLLVAAFLAAAMSTFSAVINASAAYWANDIYQAYLHPAASDRRLVWQNRLASVVIVVIGLFFSFNTQNINDIWGWLTTGLGVGLAIPLLLRWYWWRFNGYGFAIGTVAGIIAAIAVKAIVLDPQYQEYLLFLAPGICSLLGCIVGTLLTEPTQRHVLEHFYAITRPFGFWGNISHHLESHIQTKIRVEHRQDIFATFLAVPWQLVLFLMGIMLIMKRWDNLQWLALIFLLLSIGLYFTWFRHLSKEVKVFQDKK